MKLLLLLIALSSAIDAGMAQPLQVFLSPAGDDSRDGLTLDLPIKSLARAHDTIARHLAREHNDAEIRIAPGTYFGQSVDWSFFMPGHTITFMPVSDDKNRPIFDGEGRGTWFTFHGHTDGASTNFVHAIYAAHGSAENLILRNRFETCSGDPVRFRDGSDRNTVEGNRFIRSGIAAAVTDWFCDHDIESDCTKPTAECPSWSNTVKDNLLDRNFAGAELEATSVFSDRIPSGCGKPSPDAKRFIASGNRKP